MPFFLPRPQQGFLPVFGSFCRPSSSGQLRPRHHPGSGSAHPDHRSKFQPGFLDHLGQALRRFNDVFNDAILTPDGGYLLIGKSNSPIHGDKTQATRGSYDYWLVKVDPNGNKTWDKRYGGASNDEAHGVVAAPDGGYLILGTSNSSADGDKTQTSRGQSDYWAIKLDADGNKTWDKRYGGSLDETAASLVAASDGGYLMFGNSNSQAGGDKSDAPLGQQDYWAVKIDGNGNKVWDKTYGGTSGDYAYSALATDDGGFLLLGYSSSGAGGNKTDPGAGDKDFGPSGSMPPET